jgi:hypothetical protein
MTTTTYIPPKIRDAVERLAVHQDAAQLIAELRFVYSTQGSLCNAVHKGRLAVLEQQRRHPSYAGQIDAWRQDIVNDVGAECPLETARRIKEFKDFTSCDLKRQYRMQKQCRLGGAVFSHAADGDRLKAMSLVPDYFDRIRLPEAEAKAYYASQRSVLVDACQNVIRVEQGDDIVQWARKVLSDAGNEHVCDVAVALAICTGRRMVEILHMGSFEADTGNTMKFSGKAKAGLLGGETKVYRIPVLARSAVIVEAVNSLRSRVGIRDARQVNTTWCRKFNDATRSRVHPDMTFRDLRALYANMSFEICRPHTYSINAWVQSVLCHEGLTMSLHYTKLQVFGLHRYRRTSNELCCDYAPSYKM